MLSSGIPPVLPPVITSPAIAALQPGQTYAGVIRAQNSALLLQIGAHQIPLSEGTALAPGDRVLVQVQAAGNALRLEILPAPPAASAGAPAPAPAPATGLDALLKPLLQALGKLDQAPRLASLLPPRLPSTSVSLQPLLTTLLSERTLGQDLQQLQQWLAGASARGVLSTESAGAVAQWLGLASPALADAWRNLLERARAERAAAARIAQSLGGRGDRSALAGPRDSASMLAQRLLDDPGFVTWLRERNDLESFKALAQRLQERVHGADLQNLRSLDQPYQFLELPVHEGGGFLRAHVHSFADGRGVPKQNAPATHHTILDLETTQLGPLWIALQATGNACACRIRTADPEVAALFEAEAPALQEALGTAGYGSVTITAETWDGDRDEALYRLFAPFQKLDLEG